MKRSWLLWLLAVVITLLAVFYQRSTGPTHPKKIQVTLSGNTYTLSFPRSLITDISPEQAKGDWKNLGKFSVLKIRIKAKDEALTGLKETPVNLYYKRLRSSGDWQKVEGFVEKDGRIKFTLPAQPPAGKIAYYLEISGVVLEKEEPIVARFRSDVPAWALIPHILFMFAVMLFSTLCGLLAIWNDIRWKKYAWFSLGFLFVGGFILGPIVQKFAFGAYWTGWPLGQDLTDTKTLIAAAFWIIALIFSGKKAGRFLAILAAIALLAVYSIPHSTAGSDFNYETGQVETGTK